MSPVHEGISLYVCSSETVNAHAFNIIFDEMQFCTTATNSYCSTDHHPSPFAFLFNL